MTETIDSTVAFGRPEWEPADEAMPADLDGPKLLVGTRKGAWILAGDGARRAWAVAGPMFLGHIIQHVVLDPRDGATAARGLRTGHLGPTVFRSQRPRPHVAGGEPSPRPSPEGDAHGRCLNAVFWLTPGHADEPGIWYAGGSPQGLFRTEDGGDTWEPVAGWNDHPRWGEWAEWPDVEGTPDGSMLHSVIVDPRDPRHLYIGLSGGGVFESTDGGADWAPLNAGCAADFLPDPNPEFGHDPHSVRLHPLQPDRLYQQNHCGIYRLDRPDTHLGAHRRQHAPRGRRHRLPDRAAPARSRHGVGVPDGRHRRVAAHEPRRPAGGLRHPRRRRRRGRGSTTGSRRGAGSR